MDYANRLSRAAEEQARGGVDALVIAPSADLVYLIGYDPPPLERLTALVLRPGRDPALLVPQLEVARAEHGPAAHLLDIESWRDGEDPYEKLRGILPVNARWGVSDRMWALHLLGLQNASPGSTFVPASQVLARLRERKDAEEMDLLRRAARAADEAFRRITGEALEGKREEQVARLLSKNLTACGHDSVAFTIVASGPNGASPHHEPGSRAVDQGDAVVLDFGGRVEGYCSDISRTIAIGSASQEVREVHEIVRSAQEAAFRAAQPGVPAEEVDRAARRVIEDAGYGETFVHRTGHGIGLEEHERPYIVEGNDQALEPGMCFSIEPGIYLKGKFGVRIEDIVAVTDSRAVRLNEAPSDLIVVA